ncbi:MAG: alpha/beta hydrolase [Alphaproteobacteria bacterium]|jgi:pimeloyl-ACP methyl ester carboxylesterase|nr:alpha/beta hydrolase [Alphaproteobacteria bacterium]MDP6516416.1 alpha/beta hydrolase [Alphaproteobacteria bacterium]
MPHVETETGRLHYDVCERVAPWVERPRTILFHHGVAANLGLWSGWLGALAERYRLVRFDMRGFGDSVRPGADYVWSYDGLTDDLLAVADAAGAGRFHFVGESMGGTIGIALALRAPDRVLSLALSNAAARGGRISNVTGWKDMLESEGQAGWARQMMAWRFHSDALAPEVHRWFLHVHETCSMDATLALAELLIGTDLSARLGEISVPTLLLSPDGSPFISLDLMADMRAAIPDAELQVFAHSRHGLPLSHGADCARVLAEFLDRRFG